MACREGGLRERVEETLLEGLPGGGQFRMPLYSVEPGVVFFFYRLDRAVGSLCHRGEPGSDLPDRLVMPGLGIEFGFPEDFLQAGSFLDPDRVRGRLARRQAVGALFSNEIGKMVGSTRIAVFSSG